MSAHPFISQHPEFSKIVMGEVNPLFKAVILLKESKDLTSSEPSSSQVVDVTPHSVIDIDTFEEKISTDVSERFVFKMSRLIRYRFH